MMKIPITIMTDPRAFSKDIFSWNSNTAVSVEKRGVTEDIGTARNSSVRVRL
jgi:hypothetical protein